MKVERQFSTEKYDKYALRSNNAQVVSESYFLWNSSFSSGTIFID